MSFDTRLRRAPSSCPNITDSELWVRRSLGWEAQNVIALRLMPMAVRSPGSQTEVRRMVTEKVAALAEAQSAAATAVIIKGGKSHRVAKKVLGVYKKRVRANRRRLTRK
jgi:hypothetical protein